MKLRIKKTVVGFHDQDHAKPIWGWQVINDITKEKFVAESDYQKRLCEDFGEVILEDRDAEALMGLWEKE